MEIILIDTHTHMPHFITFMEDRARAFERRYIKH